VGCKRDYRAETDSRAVHEPVSSPSSSGLVGDVEREELHGGANGGVAADGLIIVAGFGHQARQNSSGE
jgi:hypothetical protein